MAMINCPECGTEMSDTALSCPKCGAVKPKPSSNWLGWIGGGLFVLVLILFMGYQNANSPEGKAKSEARAAISLCWSDYERKSLGGAEKQFIAKTCEAKVDEFRKKFGTNP